MNPKQNPYSNKSAFLFALFTSVNAQYFLDFNANFTIGIYDKDYPLLLVVQAVVGFNFLREVFRNNVVVVVNNVSSSSSK